MSLDAYREICGMGKEPGPGGGGGLVRGGSSGRAVHRGIPTSRRSRTLRGIGQEMVAAHLPFVGELPPPGRAQFASAPRVSSGVTLRLFRGMAGIGADELTPEQIDALEQFLSNEANRDELREALQSCELPAECERIAVPPLQLAGRMAGLLDMDLSQRPDGWTLEEWGGYVGLQWGVVEENLRSYYHETAGIRDQLADQASVAGEPSIYAYYADALQVIDLRMSIMRCALNFYQMARCGRIVLFLDTSSGRTYWALRSDVERVYGPPSEIRTFDYSGMGLAPLVWVLVVGIPVVLSITAISAAVAYAEIKEAKNTDAGNRATLMRSYRDAADANDKAAQEARERGDETTAQHLEERADSIRREAAEQALEQERARGSSEAAEAEAGSTWSDAVKWGFLGLLVLKAVDKL